MSITHQNNLVVFRNEARVSIQVNKTKALMPSVSISQPMLKSVKFILINSLFCLTQKIHHIEMSKKRDLVCLITFLGNCNYLKKYRTLLCYIKYYLIILTVERLSPLWSQAVLHKVWYANLVSVCHEIRTETENKCLEIFKQFNKIIFCLINLIKIETYILNL